MQQKRHARNHSHITGMLTAGRRGPKRDARAHQETKNAWRRDEEKCTTKKKVEGGCERVNYTKQQTAGNQLWRGETQRSLPLSGGLVTTNKSSSPGSRGCIEKKSAPRKKAWVETGMDPPSTPRQQHQYFRHENKHAPTHPRLSGHDTRKKQKKS